MPDFKTMIKGMEEKETPETPTQEETEKAGKLADSGFKIGEHRFIGKDNNKANPGFIAYGGNNPDQKLSAKELAKIYDEQQKAKSVSPEQDRLTKLKKDAIAESQATAKKEAPLVEKPSARSGSYKGVNIVSTPSGHFIKDEKNSIQYSFETIDKAKEYIDNAEKAKGGMFDQYGLVTEKGKSASDEFKREKGIKDYYSLSNDQFNALAKEAMEKYGIKDFELAQEFLISNSQDDKDLDKLLEIRRKPKQENNLLMGLTPEQRQAHYERIFKENDANDEIFGGKGRAYGDLTDLYNGYDIPKGQPFDENLTDEHNKKMLEEFDDYVQQRGWYPEKGKEKYPDKARRGEEDIMAEYRNIKQNDIPEAIRQLEEKKKTAKTDEEWERYDEQSRLLLRDWEENYGREPEDDDTPADPRLLKPTDDFTDAEIKNFLDYLFYTNIDQGYTYEKTPQGDYYTNLVAGDPEAEPVVVNEEQLKGFLRNSLQNVDNLAQNLYEWQIDNQ